MADHFECSSAGNGARGGNPGSTVGGIATGISATTTATATAANAAAFSNQAVVECAKCRVVQTCAKRGQDGSRHVAVVCRVIWLLPGNGAMRVSAVSNGMVQSQDRDRSKLAPYIVHTWFVQPRRNLGNTLGCQRNVSVRLLLN